MVRLLSLVLLLSLAGCYSTVPDKRSAISSNKSKAVIYYVRSSDTLYSIGKKYGLDYHLIARRNHIRKPYKIYAGQWLYIDRMAPQAKSSVKRAYKASKKRVKRAKKHRRSSHKSVADSYGKGTLTWPVSGKLISRFGRRGSRMHDGIDIAAKEGSPVRAAASGEVVYSDSRLAGYGNLVIIRHGRNLFTAYAHNQKNLVKKGAMAKKGQVIAKVGSTGRAASSRLHFEVRKGSTPVDPLVYLRR